MLNQIKEHLSTVVASRYQARQSDELSYICVSHVEEIACESAGNEFVALCQAPPFRGLISETFKASEFYPSAKDVAVALAVSAETSGEDYSIAKTIDFSYVFIEKLKRRIISVPKLNQLFSRFAKDVRRLSTDVDRHKLKATMAEHKTLFAYYFKSFEDKNFSVEMVVTPRHNEQSSPSCQLDDPIQLTIDPSAVREGFFLSQFNYSQNGVPLTHATRYNGYEYFNGMDIGLGKRKDVIWS